MTGTISLFFFSLFFLLSDPNLYPTLPVKQNNTTHLLLSGNIAFKKL